MCQRSCGRRRPRQWRECRPIAKIPPCPIVPLSRRSGPTRLGAGATTACPPSRLGIVTEVFGLPRPEFDVDWYDADGLRRAPRPGAAGRRGEHQHAVRAGRLRGGRHRHRPGRRRRARRPVAGAVVDALRSGARPRRPDRVDLLRRVRAGRRRAARRPARHHPLAVRRAAAPAVPGRRGRPRRALRRRRRRAHQRRQRGRAGPVPAPGAQRPRRRRSPTRSPAGWSIPPHRDGGQAQFIEAPVPADVRRRPDRPQHGVGAGPPDRAAHRRRCWPGGRTCRARTYLRHFARAAGTSPIRWLIEQRVQASLALLETTDRPVETVAAAVGFDTSGDLPAPLRPGDAHLAVGLPARVPGSRRLTRRVWLVAAARLPSGGGPARPAAQTHLLMWLRPQSRDQTEVGPSHQQRVGTEARRIATRSVNGRR